MSRFTTSLGQYIVFAGGLHPLVIPASAMAFMSASKIEPLSSVK